MITRIIIPVLGALLLPLSGHTADYAAETTQEGMPTGMKKSMPLEGTKWHISAIPDPKTLKEGQPAFEDTMSFQNGQVILEKSLESGFPATKYKSELKEGQHKFVAELKSPKEGTAKYVGFVTCDRLSGTIDWKRKDGSKAKFTFDGMKEEGITPLQVPQK